MGKRPYYPDVIPDKAIFSYGIRLCNYTPREKESSTYETCPVWDIKLRVIYDKEGCIMDYFCPHCGTCYEEEELILPKIKNTPQKNLTEFM